MNIYNFASWGLLVSIAPTSSIAVKTTTHRMFSAETGFQSYNGSSPSHRGRKVLEDKTRRLALHFENGHHFLVRENSNEVIPIKKVIEEWPQIKDCPSCPASGKVLARSVMEGPGSYFFVDPKLERIDKMDLVREEKSSVKTVPAKEQKTKEQAKEERDKALQHHLFNLLKSNFFDVVEDGKNVLKVVDPENERILYFSFKTQ